MLLPQWRVNIVSTAALHAHFVRINITGCGKPVWLKCILPVYIKSNEKNNYVFSPINLIFDQGVPVLSINKRSNTKKIKNKNHIRTELSFRVVVSMTTQATFKSGFWGWVTLQEPKMMHAKKWKCSQGSGSKHNSYSLKKNNIFSQKRSLSLKKKKKSCTQLKV